jgi:hypothetical protein
MAPPHSGPVIKTQSSPGLYWYRVGIRQKKPFTDVLPLSFMKGTISQGVGNPNHGGNPASYALSMATWNDASSGSVSRTVAKAHEKFSSSVQERAQLGADIGEYHQTLSMLTGAAKKIGDVAQAVRKKDFGQLLNALDPRGKKAMNGKKPSWGKAFSDNFLAVHFGWVPLAQDLHDAAHALSEPIKAPKVRSSSSDTFQQRYFYDAGSGYFARDDWDLRVRTKMGADVACTNPALHLASQLGITNPIAIAWELVPFSFVVDWFSNVGQFVGQLDEFAGLSLNRAYTTQSATASGLNVAGNPNWSPPAEAVIWQGMTVERSSGIASVPLVLKPLKLPSPIRAITAVSLMIQQLSR